MNDTDERKRRPLRESAETMAQRQREISVSEFFLKNRHLLGFDSPRRALLTAVKEAVDNSLDACEEAGILPEISVDLRQTAASRFRVTVTDNGPGIVRAQIPKIFAKLLYGSKFHRLRMSRGQQGIGISAAGMYGQLTTGQSTRICSRTGRGKPAHLMEVQIDTRANKPAILHDDEMEWRPAFPAPAGEAAAGPVPAAAGRKTGVPPPAAEATPQGLAGDPAPGAASDLPVTCEHGTSVSIEMEAAYVRGRLSVDEYLQQCAIVNPHLQLHWRLGLLPKENGAKEGDEPPAGAGPARPEEWTTFRRAVKDLPPVPAEIRPHPHGVELGVLMQMLKDSRSRTLKTALTEDFSRVSGRVALEICQRAGLEPKASPTRIAHRESEALYKAIAETRLMRPPTDCLSPIGEDAIIAGLRKEIRADFYTAVSRSPEVYRGNPFAIEVGMAYARPDDRGSDGEAAGTDEPVRVLRFANRVPLLYQAGACAITRAVTGVNWKAYGLAQPKGGLPLGPVVILVHMASVWVPFTSESKDAIAGYAEILREITYALQECGRRLSVFLSRRRREAEAERKRSYIELYIPHLALGLKEVLSLSSREEAEIRNRLAKMLERTHLDI